jgi:3-oxoacyl-[acyl-carrier-protein] synthase II
MQRRVVITSMGVISPLGFTPEQIIDNLKKEKVCFERSPVDHEVITCPIKNFDIKTFTGRFKDARYLNRGAGFAAASAMGAVKESGLDKEPLTKAGLFVGTGPNLDIGGEFARIRDGKMDEKGLAALWILKFLPNTAASAIARLAGIHGENATIGTACSAALQAVGEAFRKIKNGYLDLAFAGGGDSRLSHGGILAYKKARALFIGDGDPEKAYAPFDKQRQGFVPGEGGAFFLLESLEHAQRRKAKIYGEVCGFGNSIDGYNMTAPDPDGKWGEKAIRGALKEAGLLPDQIDAISAHGTGTPLNDAMEASLIDRIYGEHKPCVIALKSWIGHIAAACGAVELAVCLTCLKNNYLPAIRNLKEPCHEKINFVQTNTDACPGTMMMENFGFGGQNSALVIKKWIK